MSSALIKKSLELISSDADLTKDKCQKKKRKSTGVLDLLPVNHRLISKNKKGSTATLKRSSKVTVSEAKKRLQLKTDATEENVKRLLLLSTNKLDVEVTNKLVCRATRKPYETQLKKQETAEAEATVFTEEDFKKFEEEYFEL